MTKKEFWLCKVAKNHNYAKICLNIDWAGADNWDFIKSKSSLRTCDTRKSLKKDHQSQLENVTVEV